MSNFLLFVLGLAITLISGLGVLVYMASLGYKRSEIKKAKKLTEQIVFKEYPSIEIPSVS